MFSIICISGSVYNLVVKRKDVMSNNSLMKFIMQHFKIYLTYVQNSYLNLLMVI